jgi:hypothetical protein
MAIAEEPNTPIAISVFRRLFCDVSDAAFSISLPPPGSPSMALSRKHRQEGGQGFTRSSRPIGTIDQPGRREHRMVRMRALIGTTLVVSPA